MLDTMMHMAALTGVLLGADPIGNPKPCTQDFEPSRQEIKETLFWLYLRAPKEDWIKERRRISFSGKKAKWRISYKPQPFGWKDQAAAERLNMTLPDYVFDRAVPEFRRSLYCMTAAAIEEGHNVVISSVFREDWRQSIATGRKARNTDSYHGGSRRGGIGRAADVSVDGTWKQKAAFWDWIDKNGPARFKIGRPYGRGDPPHVGPTDAPEYMARHGDSRVRVAAKKRPKLAHHASYKHKKIRIARR